MPDFKEIIDDAKDASLFFTFRVIAIILGAYIGYYVMTTYMSPVLDDLCLTNTKNCHTIELYRNKNTFVVRDDVSQIWAWYNGANLYVYGQAPGVCQSPSPEQLFKPVNVFQMKLNSDKNVIQFTTLPNECIDDVSTIVNYYKNTLLAPSENFILKKQNPSSTINIYDMIQSMYDNNIFRF